MEGFELFVDGIPFARPAGSGSVIVEVIWPVPSLYDQVLADVDSLEGYSPYRHPPYNLYERLEVVVKLDRGGEVRAWMYQIGASVRRFTVSRETLVPSGNYADVETGTWTHEQGRC